MGLGKYVIMMAIIACFFTTAASGEIYQGILPFSTMADLKKLFPGAEFNYVKTAWAQESEYVYKIVGPGLPGTIMVKMNDFSFYFKNYMKENPEEEFNENFRSMAIPSDETATVEWVRYIPNNTIPLERIITKYGKIESSGFSETDFRPYKKWDSKGVFASLSDNGKEVVMLDFYFTEAEKCEANAKSGFIPEECKDKKTKNQPKKIKK